MFRAVVAARATHLGSLPHGLERGRRVLVDFGSAAVDLGVRCLVKLALGRHDGFALGERACWEGHVGVQCAAGGQGARASNAVLPLPHLSARSPVRACLDSGGPRFELLRKSTEGGFQVTLNCLRATTDSLQVTRWKSLPRLACWGKLACEQERSAVRGLLCTTEASLDGC